MAKKLFWSTYAILLGTATVVSLFNAGVNQINHTCAQQHNFLGTEC